VNVVALILLIVAAVLFAIAGLVAPYSARLVSLGLAALSVGLIFQFGFRSHHITF
jgi:hypothetical protein